MIYLIHGPDLASSRNFLLRLRSQYQSITVVDLKKTKTSFDLPSENLFQEKSLLIIENLIPEKVEKLLPRVNSDIAIWLAETLDTVPKWVEKEVHFKLLDTTSTFKLTDLIFLGQEKQALLTLEKLSNDSTPTELIIGSLVRQLRQISLVLAGETEQVSKSNFVQNKIKDQAKNWNSKKVKAAGLFVLKADLTMKKGLLSAKLVLAKLVIELCSLVNS